MFHKATHFHFVGCKAPLLSGLVKIMMSQGYAVSACDTSSHTDACRKLKESGCALFNKHSSEHTKKADVVVYAPHTKNSGEVSHAKSHNKTVISLSHLLGTLLSRSYGITALGSSGTAFTAACISHILKSLDKDPSFVLDAAFTTTQTSAHFGSGEWFVTHAPTTDETILNLKTTIALITHIEDEYAHGSARTEQEVTESLDTFLSTLPFFGIAVINKDDKQTRHLISRHQHHAITYGFDRNSDMRAELVMLGAEHSLFNVYSKQEGLLGTITLPTPGMDAVLYALAALTVCYKLLGLSFHLIGKALSRFPGITRSFERIGSYRSVPVFDDSATMPHALDAAFSTARNYTRGKLHIIFKADPEKISRYWDSFIALFTQHANQIDTLHVLPFVSTSPDQDHATFVREIEKATEHNALYCYQEDDEVIDALGYFIQPHDLILTVGTQDITKLHNAFKKKGDRQ